MIKELPFTRELETISVLKRTALAERALAELKGITPSIPNKEVLLSTLALQEAKASSEIENIVTTHDALFQSQLNPKIFTAETKEINNYSRALHTGYKIVSEKKLLTNEHICQIQGILEGNNAGFRNQSGTNLKNNLGEVIYTPPQDIETINKLMRNLEKFINDDEISDINPIIKMAMIHYQFESIHPFYDGNGRTGRIINILYLINKGLLDIPVLYLSRYIIENKQEYYHLLQETRDKQNWEKWILFILEGVIQTSKDTTKMIHLIHQSMTNYKRMIRRKYPTIYSQDLINALFKYPYTRIDFIKDELKCHRETAAKYLNILSEDNLLDLRIIGKNNYYINKELFDLLIHWRDK